MADNNTLMAYLVPRLTSGVEDAATEAMAYILNKSDGAMTALNDLLSQDGFAVEPIARVRTQVTYGDGCIPDMAGYDEDDRTRLLVEAKFWAAFGDGQVRQYALHLDQPGPAVLLIIGPEVRRQTLWAEAKQQMSEVGELKDIGSQTGANRARVVWSQPRDSQLHLVIVSWAWLLDRIADHAGGAAVLEDIRQLRGLAQRQDEEGFLPLHGEDLSPSFAHRVVWYNQIVDDAVDARGVQQGWLNIERLRAASNRWGYGRWLRFSGVDATFLFGVNHYLWARNRDTPLWLGLWLDDTGKEASGKVDRSLKEEFVDVDGFRWIPVYLKTGVEYDAVLNDVAAQLKRIGEAVRESLA